MEGLLFETKEQVARITLNRPEVLNALSSEVYKGLAGVLERIAEDRGIRVVIITGAGQKAFAAGADISRMQSLSVNEARFLAILGQRVFQLVGSLPQPVIAAVNGIALGGGCELALACDLIVASTHAKFGQPEINLAVIPGAGATQRLPRLIGMAQAKELIFTGKIISAEEAFQLGMINQVVAPDELMSTTEKMATELCKKAPVAMSLAKAAVNKSFETTMRVGFDYEVECFASCFATQDQKEGMAAFLEKRAPRIKGL
jgi:enoyl-CoA hydratase